LCRTYVPNSIASFHINKVIKHHARIIIPSVFLGVMVGWMTLTSSGRGMVSAAAAKTKHYTLEHPYRLHREKCAYVTILTTENHLTDSEEFLHYFNGARVLAYQLLQAPDTRDNKE